VAAEDKGSAFAAWRKAEGHARRFDPVVPSAHHGPDIVDPHVVGLRKIKLGLLATDAKLQILHHLPVFGPRTCCP
jgi:hypothetical protein